MKAFVPTGDSERVVALADVAEPDPAADEVVVAVEAYSVNRGETFLLERPAQGWRPGKDVAGVVVRSASDGSGPREGTRVVAHPHSGGWAERVVAPARQIAELPRAVDVVTAAALPLAGLTALRLLRTVGSGRKPSPADDWRIRRRGPLFHRTRSGGRRRADGRHSYGRAWRAPARARRPACRAEYFGRARTLRHRAGVGGRRLFTGGLGQAPPARHACLVRPSQSDGGDHRLFPLLGRSILRPDPALRLHR